MNQTMTDILLDKTGELRDTTDELSFLLRPSPLEGVGIFCTHGIKKGTLLRVFPPAVAPLADTRFVPLAKMEKNTMLNAFSRRFGVEAETGCHVPFDFGRMEIGWYLNHHAEPNAHHNDKYDYFASRDIQAGEEITIDYDTL